MELREFLLTGHVSHGRTFFIGNLFSLDVIVIAFVAFLWSLKHLKCDQRNSECINVFSRLLNWLDRTAGEIVSIMISVRAGA